LFIPILFFLPSFINLSWLNLLWPRFDIFMWSFLFLVNTALILKVKTKNVNITKGVSLFSFSRNFSFLWCFAKIFWWFFFYSLGFSGDSCYKLLVDDFVQVLTFLWSFVFLKTKQVCQTETSMVGWSHWSWCQQMDI